MPYKLTTDKTWAQVETDIRAQLKLWGCSTFSLQRGVLAPPAATSKPVEQPVIPPRSRPSAFETPEQATVTLTAKWPESRERAPLVIKYNKQARAVDNARVIFLALESLRLNEVRGIDDVMREIYKALPAPGEEVEIIDPYEILGILRTSPAEVVEGAYKALARANHDSEADDATKEAQLKRLNKARDLIRVERGIA